jgi:hypothetical protein
MVVLDGGIDDPDGLGQPTDRERAEKADDEGWDLDAPEVPDDDEDDPAIEES